MDFQKSGVVLLIKLKPIERVFTIKIDEENQIHSFDFPEFEEDIFYNFCVMLGGMTVLTLLPLNN